MKLSLQSNTTDKAAVYFQSALFEKNAASSVVFDWWVHSFCVITMLQVKQKRLLMKLCCKSKEFQSLPGKEKETESQFFSEPVDKKTLI